VPRDEYLEETGNNRRDHRALAKQLKAHGMSLRKIGSELGRSHTYVRELLNSEE
jgi:biotin operon repressor